MIATPKGVRHVGITTEESTVPKSRWVGASLLAFAMLMHVAVRAQDVTKNWDCYDAQPGHPTDAEKASFVEQISSLATTAEKKHGVPTSALAAMAIVESGYGWTRTAQSAQNLFGWKFYSSAAAGGRKSYVLACQPKEDDNNRYVVFANNEDSFDFVAKKLATLPAYSIQTKLYQDSRAKGVTTANAAKAWIAGIANPYNWHPKEYTAAITRVMNNALAPSDAVSENRNLYRLSDGTAATATGMSPTATAASTTAADTDAIFTKLKARFVSLGAVTDHCDPPVMDFPRWKGFPVQLCGYTDTVSVRTYMLNASPEQRAHWIVNACIDIHAPSTSSCADSLFKWIKDASSGGVFPVAGFIPEPASSGGGHGSHPVCYLFRDGVTIAVEGVDSPSAVNNKCDFGGDINDRPVKEVKAKARIASTLREDYIAYSGKPESTVDGLKWIDVIRDLYQRAWTSDHNDLVTAKARALVVAAK